MNKIPMSVVFGSLALLIVCCGTGCVSVPSTDDIPVVKGFDAARYMGLWHEIARLPKWYERDMINVSAEYALDGDVLRIKNRGWRDNEMKVSTAVGYFAGPSDEGAFRISFFRPFYGDYRIVWLSPDYDLALVTGEDRSSLWILSRTSTIPAERRDMLVKMASDWGFDVSKLEYPK